MRTPLLSAISICSFIRGSVCRAPARRGRRPSGAGRDLGHPGADAAARHREQRNRRHGGGYRRSAAAHACRMCCGIFRDLNVVQTGGPGGQTSVFMRGTNPNHTKVLIDGIDVSDPSNPSADFDFGPAPDPGHRADRGAARTAKRPLRLGCHRRRDQHHHAQRHRAGAPVGQRSKAAHSIRSIRARACAAPRTSCTTAPISSTSMPARPRSLRSICCCRANGATTTMTTT